MSGAQNRALLDELTTDPLTRGYSGMTDQQAADDLNDASLRPAPDRTEITRQELWQAIDLGELDALQSSADANDVIRVARLQMLLTFDTLGTRDTDNTRTDLLRIFTQAGSPLTRAALVTLVTGVTQSRASELGLGAVTADRVAAARA